MPDRQPDIGDDETADIEYEARRELLARLIPQVVKLIVRQQRDAATILTEVTKLYEDIRHLREMVDSKSATVLAEATTLYETLLREKEEWDRRME